MKNKAIYAGTFDPITFGHVDLIERAVSIFDNIIIGIAASPKKQPMFSLEERIELTKKVLRNVSNISVVGFEGLLIEFAKQQGVNVIMRGLRTVTDFDYEFQLASMNRRMYPDIETVFLIPDDKYMAISSTLVREIAILEGNVKEFVPEAVVEALKTKAKT